MNEYNVPVLSVLPKGRVEWAVSGPFLYGIDRTGQVFRLGRPSPKGAPDLLTRIRKWWRS